jgi:cytochrome c
VPDAVALSGQKEDLMKSMLIAVVAMLTLGAAGIAGASEALAKSDGCLNCHAVDTKKIGPAFKDIAAKYKGQADAEAKLVAKLKEGKAHPATKASEDDTKAIVKWVLAM